MPKGVTDWHRQQRKKELQKNKAARIAARDERVKHEKTEASVQEEIRKIERQFKNPELRPHNIKSKLDRLQKELKLVKEEESAKKEKEDVTKKRKFQQKPTNYQPLENPQLSVYYDAVMNPFGAPPPGKPRLYHRRGGGVTMNLKEAGMPGESAQPPPPPPPRPAAAALPPPPPLPSQRKPPQGEIRDPSRPTPPDAPAQRPPPPSPPRRPPPREQPTLVEESKAPKELDKTKKAKSTEMPALPPPSAAVQRSKRKLASDIWASTEEMEYEESSGIGTLEGVAQQHHQQQRRSNENNKQWWYQDTTSQVQGPFPTDQMKQWVQAGFFPVTTFVRPSAQSSWKPLKNVEAFASLVGSDTSTAENNVTPHAPDNQNTGLSTVQDRIAALRGQHVQEKRSVDTNDATIEVSASEQQQQTIDSAVATPQSVQDRIAALRQEHIQNQQLDDDTNGDFNRALSVQDRIEALRQQDVREKHEHDETSKEDSADAKEEGVPPSRGPIHPMEDPDVPPPPPPPAAATVATDSISIPSYPIDEVPAYPVDDDAQVDDTIPYPVDVEYPITDEYYSAEGGSLPVSGAYPIDEPDNSSAPSQTADGAPSKKKLKVDKELTAFLPLHLQKKAMSRK